MPIYNVTMEVAQIRSYEIQAESEADAERLGREELTMIPYDILNTEIAYVHSVELIDED